MTSGVYEIEHRESGKKYIGNSIDMSKRWKAHRFHLQRGTHHSPHLQSAWAKYGADAFDFRPLLICKPEDAVMYEQIAMDAMHPVFNVARTAGSCLGVKRSEASKAKQAAAMAGNAHTKGMAIHTSESKARLAERMRGNTNTKGCVRSAEAVAATAAAHRGMRRSDETKRRISEARTGKQMPPRTEAHRAALSAALKGKRPPQEAIDRMAATKRGSRLSEEHKARIGAASRAAWARRKKEKAPC